MKSLEPALECLLCDVTSPVAAALLQTSVLSHLGWCSSIQLPLPVPSLAPANSILLAAVETVSLKYKTDTLEKDHSSLAQQHSSVLLHHPCVRTQTTDPLVLAGPHRGGVCFLPKHLIPLQSEDPHLLTPPPRGPSRKAGDLLPVSISLQKPTLLDGDVYTLQTFPHVHLDDFDLHSS